MAPRPKKRATEQTAETTNSFVSALKFVSAVTRDIGAPHETHVVLNNNRATAFNGVLAAGATIEDDIFAAPNNKLMVEALSKCGEHLSITQLDNGRLSIKSDKFKAIVPCIDPTILQIAFPDQERAIIDDRLKAAFEAVGVLANENATTVYGASLLMNGQSLIGCDGTMLFEYWHGIDLPTNLAIPKSISQPIVKCSKALTGFGFSNSSATFYFDDASWLRTQLYCDQWPDVARILDIKCDPWPVPADLFKGLAAVAPHSPDGMVHFDAGILRSHSSDGAGASYEVAGLPKGPVHSIKQLNLIKPHATSIDFFAQGPHGPMLIFYGDRIRGCIAGRSK